MHHLALLLTLLAVRMSLHSASALPLQERDGVAYFESGTLIMAGPASTTMLLDASSDDLPTSAEDRSMPPLLATAGQQTMAYLPYTSLFPSPPLLTVATSTQTIIFRGVTTATATATAMVYTSESTSDAPTQRTFTKTRTAIRVKNKGTPTATLSRSLGSWSLRKDFGQDISSEFGVKTWAWGQSLVTVLPSLPSATPSVSVKPQRAHAKPSMQSDLNTGSVLQVKYPEGSVNPGNQPQGGVGFYAAPIDLTKANNVSFSYSVYFPSDFDFVKGGKLPGLYGGHGGCSGGKQSEDCFSTRLMFRKDGMGELYLYSPKGVQSQSLCSTPPTTYCDATYGYSIGRGAWYWKRGQWSDVRQDIWLNTPGRRDGGFNIWVNGELVLHSDEVMYRNSAAPPKSSKGSPALADPTGVVAQTLGDEDQDVSETDAPSESETSAPEDDGSAGILDVATGLLTGIVKRDSQNVIGNYVGPVQTRPRMGWARMLTPIAQNDTSSSPTPTPALQSQPPTVMSPHAVSDFNTSIIYVSPALQPPNSNQRYLGHDMAAMPVALATKAKSVTFLGMMFDTFFGGSDDSWASPREQYTYFNDVALNINS